MDEGDLLFEVECGLEGGGGLFRIQVSALSMNDFEVRCQLKIDSSPSEALIRLPFNIHGYCLQEFRRELREMSLGNCFQAVLSTANEEVSVTVEQEPHRAYQSVTARYLGFPNVSVHGGQSSSSHGNNLGGHRVMLSLGPLPVLLIDATSSVYRISEFIEVNSVNVKSPWS